MINVDVSFGRWGTEVSCGCLTWTFHLKILTILQNMTKGLREMTGSSTKSVVVIWRKKKERWNWGKREKKEMEDRGREGDMLGKKADLWPGLQCCDDRADRSDCRNDKEDKTDSESSAWSLGGDTGNLPEEEKNEMKQGGGGNDWMTTTHLCVLPPD